LLAEIRRGITRRIEAGLMKYVSRMHVKTSPFSTFCHVAVARFESGTMTAHLGEARVTARDGGFEDSVLEGEVTCDVEAITETIASYARELAFSDPAIAIRRQVRCEFEKRYGRDACVPLTQLEFQITHDPPTAAFASRLVVTNDTVHISAARDVHAELPPTLAAVLQFTSDGAVLNGCGPGYGRLTSRFLDLLPAELLEEQRAINRGLVEFDDGSRININRHPLLVDEVIDDVSKLVVTIGDDDTLWLLRDGQRLEFVDLGLQEPSQRSPMHRFLNTVFARAEPVFRKPMVRAALAAFPRGIMKPRVVYDDRLIIRRRSWHVPKAMLPVRAPRERDAAYFARVDAWRESLGIPQYVFAKIRNAARRDDRKPQFLSFASWHSVLLFEKLIARVQHTLKLQEMLPAPDDMLVWNGRRHAAEFIVHWTRK
jgi:hypothetical protein